MADNFEVTDEELLDAFRVFDADANGTLCEEEVLTVMRAFGMWLSKAQVKKLIWTTVGIFPIRNWLII